jgi:hypothetical protein
MIALHHYANLDTIYANMGTKSEGYGYRLILYNYFILINILFIIYYLIFLDTDILKVLLLTYPESPSILNKYGESPLHVHSSLDRPDSNTILMMIEYCPESVR